MTFKTSSEIFISSIDAIELNIDKNSYVVLSDIEEALHIIEGEFLYCDLLVDAKLIVTEKQFDELLNIQPISIRKFVDSKLFIHSLTSQNTETFNHLKKRALFISSENIDTEDEYEVFKLL